MLLSALSVSVKRNMFETCVFLPTDFGSPLIAHAQLEEKVAMLEAKSDIQASENENLRDLLGRLQSENLALKQTPFTFAVQPGSDAARASKSPASVGGRVSSPNALGANMEGYDTSMAYYSPSFFGQPAGLPGSPPQVDLSAYGVGPPYTLPTQSPYTTIAANPLYMSFSETPSFSSYLSPSDSSSNSPRTPGTSKAGSATTSHTTPDIMMSPKSMQELFGTQFEGLVPFTGNFSVFSPEHSGHTHGSMSPVAHTTGDHSADSRECPKSKEEMAARIGTQSTLGPPALASAANMEVDFLTPQDREDALASCESGNDLPCHVFAAIPESSKNVSLNDAWERVSKHPQFSVSLSEYVRLLLMLFQECDMDQLCELLTAQAKCDGSKPVLEPTTVASVMERIPHMAQSNRSK